MVQRLAVHPLILCSDIQEVKLAARHHDANQGPVFCSCSLKTQYAHEASHPLTFPEAPIPPYLLHSARRGPLRPGGFKVSWIRAPCTQELHTRIALLSLSAKKAGVFFRHFTTGETQHKGCRIQPGTHYLSVPLGSLDIQSDTTHPLLLLLAVIPRMWLHTSRTINCLASLSKNHWDYAEWGRGLMRRGTNLTGA